MEICSLAVLEARRLTSRCQQGQDHLDSGWNPFWPLPGTWWEPTILGDPWLAAAALQSLPLSPHGIVSVSSYRLIRTPVILG